MTYKLKYQWKKLRVRINRYKKTIDGIGTKRDDKLSQFHEKFIRLWRVCLKDKDARLNNINNTRQVEKENILLILRPTINSYYIMSIIDNEKHSLFEVYISEKFIDDAVDGFDFEVERRMRDVENSRLSIIEKNIDILIDQEEKQLNK